MKTLRSALVALGVGSSGTLVAAPRLFVSTSSLTPESGIELILDRAVVPDETVGKKTANDWLVVEPAWPGQLEWKAPNVARFLPDRSPALGTRYKFSLGEGHKHLDQTPVPAGVVSTVDSTPFQIESAQILGRYTSDFSVRNATLFLRFNDNVDPAAAAPFFSFESATGQRIAAKTERTTLGQARDAGQYGWSWTQRFDNARAGRTEDTRKPEDAFPQGLIVSPLSPLPIGREWKLSILAGLPNGTSTAKLAENTSRGIGNVDPLQVTNVEASTIPNEPRKLILSFNHPLPDPLPADWLAKSVKITPEPTGLTAKPDGRNLELSGDFGTQDLWQVTVQPAAVSANGLTLAGSFSKEAVFKHLDPSLALPSDEQAQLAAGGRTYRIETVNLKEVRVRVKQLAGTDLVRAFQGYRHYTGNGPGDTGITPTAPLPYELMSGTTVVEKVFTLPDRVDGSSLVTLEWDKLIPDAPKNVTFFLEATGTAVSGLAKTEGQGDGESEWSPDKKPSAQAFVQLTDIGLAWKLNSREALLYAFSCTTGEPLEGVKLDVFGEDAKPLASVTSGKDGLATLSRESADVRHLRATLGKDAFVTAFDSSLATVSLWRFPVRYSWEPPADTRRRVLVFTDRSLYRPGETVRVKGVIRTQNGNAIASPDTAVPRLVVIDPTEKEVVARDVPLSANGSFDLSFTAPESQVGNYALRVEYPAELTKAEALDENQWEEKEKLMANARFEFSIRIDEFRRNAFEIEQKIAEPEPGATSVAIDLKARYYQGQPVAAGNVTHYSRISDVNLYPDNYRDFLFGNHRTEDWRYWYHYFNYRWDDETGSNGTSANGQTNLDAEGHATLSLTLPQGDFPVTRDVTVNTEVRDANNQTLTATSTTTVHPSAVYVGVSRMDRLARAGEAVSLKFVAVTPTGEAVTTPVTVEAVLTREVNEQSKSRTSSGATITRNEASQETLSTASVTIAPEGNAKDGTAFSFTPKAAGLHYLTLRGKDAQGRPFATVSSYWVYGSNEYPWAYEEGMKIKLVAEKKSYKPGETARVLVMSPIEGTALVTVERESVLRSFVVPLKTDNPVIEIPVDDACAPNAYVSVLIVKGSKDSARNFKEPQLRLGYCELTVENVKDRLAVDLTPEDSADTIPVGTTGKTLPAYRPGDEIVISGTVKRADGSAAAGSEVTLYAEDEGTLAVMGYTNPDPLGFFYDPRLLTVSSGTSLDNFISEDPDNQSFFNKGFFIGDGDEFSANADDLLRKNFDPCATWAPALVTDDQGKFRHTFKVPDTLTRYRVIAVATQGAERFGTAVTAIVINKPLMLEPKAPRFVNVSDQVTPQVLVQNASSHAGTWKITFNAHAAPGTPVCKVLANDTETVNLAAGASATVAFPITVVTTGEAVLSFKAEPVSLQGGELTPVLARKLGDAVETRFHATYPMPLMRQAKLVKLTQDGTNVELGKLLDSTLLEGDGTLELEFSRSLLMEAGGSVDYLLSYPHGCVEQTTSSLMPWFAVNELRPVVPAFQKYTDEKVQAAIQAGANRLLSMQLPDGSFAYWPGAKERVKWATSYAGLGLLLAKQSGASVPQSAIDGMTNDLVTSLRGITDETSSWEQEANVRALWVLALAGKPQASYQNLLKDKLATLAPRSRCFLALAIAAGGGEDARREAIGVLKSTVPFKGKDDCWMPWRADDATSLLAWSRIAPGSTDTTRLLDRMLRDRSPYGDWYTTWGNGWGLLALSSYASTEKGRTESVAVTVTGPKGEETIQLDASHPVATKSFATGEGFSASVRGNGVAFVRAKLASKPKIAPQQPVAKNGLEVTRFYERMKADGTVEPLDRPKVGDLIRVTLRVNLPKDDSRYLLVEDPLPSVFEAVNSEFASQSAANGASTSEKNWYVSHSELRSDRAVFYFDRVWRGGSYSLTYLARCTIAGEAVAPAAKVESMYDPENVAFSASNVIRTR